MGHGFVFVLAQEFKNRMHCLMVFTNEVETTFALEQGLLSVPWNQPRAVGINPGQWERQMCSTSKGSTLR